MNAPSASFWDGPAVRELQLNFLDERSARWMYLSLAGLDPQADRAGLLRRLADYEERHAGTWERMLVGLGQPVPPQSHFWEHWVIVALARLFGVGALLPVVHKSEVDGIAKYRRQAEAWRDPAAQEAFAVILPDEIVHEVDIFNAMRRPESGRGALRSVILGANDGLGSILALAAGVAGATGSSASVLIAGIAGLVAGAVSMAASNFVSVKAEAEVLESQVELEREALSVAPETKREQLQEAYVSHGLTEEEARTVSRRIAGRPEAFLRVLLETRHGFVGLGLESPARLAAYTGIAFGLSGMVPLVPFAFLEVRSGVGASIGLTAVALFTAGALRALSTLKPFARSGLEMVLVGMGSAAATYLVGLAVGGWLG